MEGPCHRDRLDVSHHVDRPVRRWSDRGGRGVPQSRGRRSAASRVDELPELRKSGETGSPLVVPRSGAGIGSTAKALGLPIPSGNVSFYNESALGPCPPT